MQETGASRRDVLRQLRQARGDDFSFEDGAARRGEILGSMCTAPHEIAAEAHAMFLETNLGDPGHFPGTARLERELLEDLKELLHAPAGAEGRYLTGGSEANLLACYIAREKTGKRTIVLPESGHFSFEKAARPPGRELDWGPTRADGRADPARMAKAMGKHAALAIAVAGTTELGLVDPIAELGAAAAKAKVPLHVDAAYGGYILPFLADASRTPKPFDFAVPGVWSVAMDPHKMGMATIPGGALFLRDGKDWSLASVAAP